MRRVCSSKATNTAKFRPIASILACHYAEMTERQRSLEVGAFDEFHDQIVGTDVVEVTDVGMVESRDRARFEPEAFVELLAGCLDGDVTAKAWVAGAVNLSHAAFTEERDDFVRAESFTG